MRRALAVLVMALVALVGFAAPSQASVQQEFLGLSWDGSGYAPSTAESFWGMPMLVPGDADSRTLMVRNDGPSAGVLTAEIVNVVLLDPDAVDASGDDFYDDVTVTWERDGGTDGSDSFGALFASSGRDMWSMPVEPGQVVPVTLTYSFPVESISGNQANVSERQASLVVRFTITGQTPTANPTDDPTGQPTGSNPTGQPTSGYRVESGEAATSPWSWVMIGAGVAGIALALLLARRRDTDRSQS